MKPYGIPRVHEAEFPDVADIKRFGYKFSAGGRDYFKNKAAKAAARRYWKRKERAAIKAEIDAFEDSPQKGVDE